MRIVFLAAGAALTLAACSGGGGGEAATDNAVDVNTMTVNNIVTDQDMMSTGGLDGNTATNATTENMMLNDLASNEADTNLANGL